MIDAKGLLADLQKLLTQLEDDIRRRCEGQAEVDGPLREQYAAAKGANRTAQAYEVWRDEQITQAGVAWILGCVFVRFCEDNLLIDPPRLSAPGERRKRAEDEHTLYFQRHPTHSDREYLMWVFQQVSQLPSMKELFDERHNPLWALGLSGDGAMLLRNFWLKRDAATGLLVHDFSDPAFGEGGGSSKNDLGSAGGDPTRFLGDLYQDLSESARKKYALLQTPVFVEEFILDRTLTPAIAEFGFQQVRLIDPTCGSGHFLLGGFRRLFDLWVKHEPATNVRELTQRAFNGIYGVDLNPYAIAIARFRLLVAALQACRITRLADAPGFTVHLAAGDSLLHGPRPDMNAGRQQYLLGDDPLGHVYDTEDAPLLRKYLGQQYHAVVGNPPYVIVRDQALNEEYRRRFSACSGKYSLVVPFIQRFFDLAVSGTPSGFVGVITANSFMKREFGKKLVEQFFRRWDLTHVIDTSGAYIPGHDTPTVILFARNRAPASTTLRAVLGIRGEPDTPANPALGLVWRAIEGQVDREGSQSPFVSVADSDRNKFHVHPWSIGGGGAAELKSAIEEHRSIVLGSLTSSIGYASFPGLDEAFVTDSNSLRRAGVAANFIRQYIDGESVKDWGVDPELAALTPYGETFGLVEWDGSSRWGKYLWPLRTSLENIMSFGRKTRKQLGDCWWGWYRWIPSKYRLRFSIVFANLGCQNQYALDRGGKVFNGHAPVLKFGEDARESDLLSLLGLLNSSTACFWLRQVCHNKGLRGQVAGITSEAWEQFFEFPAAALERFPVPVMRPTELATRLDHLRTQHLSVTPSMAISQSAQLDTLEGAREQARMLRGQMIALQEELDWQCYAAYGLLDSPPVCTEPPPLQFGQRAFEIVLARRAAVGEVDTAWFIRNGSTAMTELPTGWPEDYKQVVRRRIEIIESDHNIALIERPENKRRWNTQAWEEMQKRGLRSWLLDRLEGWPLKEYDGGVPGPRSLVWSEQEPRLLSVAQLADRVRQDKDFMQVAALYRDREDFDVTKLVAELVEGEAAPFLPVLRYKESGQRNRLVWEQVWELQRQEDAIDARTKLTPTAPQYLTEPQAKAEKKAKIGDIPVPPKYKSADMLNGTIWRLRGKLDVPKERFISFPHCQRDSDPTLVITWAGYDHLQQLQALAAYYIEMKEKEGWPPERRVPLLAGMLELLPWVLQWHNEIHPDFGLGMGDYYRDFINDEARGIGMTAEEIRGWTPPAKSGMRRKR